MNFQKYLDDNPSINVGTGRPVVRVPEGWYDGILTKVEMTSYDKGGVKKRRCDFDFFISSGEHKGVTVTRSTFPDSEGAGPRIHSGLRDSLIVATAVVEFSSTKDFVGIPVSARIGDNKPNVRRDKLTGQPMLGKDGTPLTYDVESEVKTFKAVGTHPDADDRDERELAHARLLVSRGIREDSLVRCGIRVSVVEAMKAPPPAVAGAVSDEPPPQANDQAPDVPW